MTDFERQNQDKFNNFERQDFEGAEGSAYERPGHERSAYDTEGRRPEQIEREIEQTRERMSRDIDALGERLSPRNLAHDAMDSVTQRARRTGSRFVDFVRENPLPVAAVGIGVTWFMTQRSKSTVSGDRMARYAYSGPERRGTGLRARVGEAASHAREAVSHAAGGAAERASEMGSGAMSHMQELGSGAKSRLQDFGTSARTQAAENPLAVAAGAAIIGLALGFLLPETRRENQMMGGTRDRLADRAGDAAHRVADATADAADEVKNTLKTELADRAPQMKGMAQDMARRVVDQAKDAAGRVKEQAKNV